MTVECSAIDGQPGRTEAPQLVLDDRTKLVGHIRLAASLLLDHSGLDVTLFERRRDLGGGLISSAAPPRKQNLDWYRDYLVDRIGESGVTVIVDTEVSVENVIQRKPSLVVVATGGQPRPHDLDADAETQVLSACDLLMHGRDQLTGLNFGRTAGYGGGETGCETAELIAGEGLDVTVITRSTRDDLARNAEPVYRRQLLARLQENSRIAVADRTQVRSVGSGDIAVVSQDGGERTLAYDTIISAQGLVVGSATASEIRRADVDCFEVGDARKVRGIGDAVQDAYLLVRSLRDQQRMKVAC